MNITQSIINPELLDQLLNKISQAEALAEVAMSLEYDQFNNSLLFYYFFTINELLERAIKLSYSLQI